MVDEKTRCQCLSDETGEQCKRPAIHDFVIGSNMPSDCWIHNPLCWEHFQAVSVLLGEPNQKTFK